MSLLTLTSKSRGEVSLKINWTLYTFPEGQFIPTQLLSFSLDDAIHKLSFLFGVKANKLPLILLSVQPLRQILYPLLRFDINHQLNCYPGSREFCRVPKLILRRSKTFFACVRVGSLLGSAFIIFSY